MKKRVWITACVFIFAAFVLTSCGNAADPGEEVGTGSTSEETVSVAEETPAAASADAESTESAADETEDDGTNGGDFDVSHPLVIFIEWDADGDGTPETVTFDYEDLGDEAASYVTVTLENEEPLKTSIDLAKRIVRIYAREDADGPYLLVEYNYENLLTEEADADCVIRLIDGELTVQHPDEDRALGYE